MSPVSPISSHIPSTPDSEEMQPPSKQNLPTELDLFLPSSDTRVQSIISDIWSCGPMAVLFSAIQNKELFPIRLILSYPQSLSQDDFNAALNKAVLSHYREGVDAFLSCKQHVTYETLHSALSSLVVQLATNNQPSATSYYSLIDTLLSAAAEKGLSLNCCLENLEKVEKLQQEVPEQCQVLKHCLEKIVLDLRIQEGHLASTWIGS